MRELLLVAMNRLEESALNITSNVRHACLGEFAVGVMRRKMKLS
jgi:hypothetical protein